MEKLFLAAVVITLITHTTRGQNQPPGPSQEEQDEALQNAADAEAAAAQKEECDVENPPASCMQKHFFNAKPYKLIYDNNCGGGQWIRVHYDECPIAFDDPEFSHHDYLCKGGSSARCVAKTEGMWTWPEYGYCDAVPVCLACPKLGNCGAWASPSHGGGSSTTVIISTNTGSGGQGHNQMSELQELMALVERGEVLSRWQTTRLETLYSTATGLSRWQMNMIKNVLDQHHRGQGGHGGHQVHGGHGGHRVQGGHGHRRIGAELQNLLDLVANGVTLMVDDVRRIQTLAANEMNLSFEQRRLIESLEQSSHGTHGGWQGGHGGGLHGHVQSGHGHGGGRQELEELMNLANRGSSLSRWQVRRMLDLASTVSASSLSSWQNGIIQTLRSQLHSSSSATHFSMSGSSGSSFGSTGTGFLSSGSSGTGFVSSSSSGVGFVSSSSSSSSSHSSQSSSSSVSAWANRFGRSTNDDADEAFVDDGDEDSLEDGDDD